MDGMTGVIVVVSAGAIPLGIRWGRGIARKVRQRRNMARPFPPEWEQILAKNLPPYGKLRARWDRDRVTVPGRGSSVVTTRCCASRSGATGAVCCTSTGPPIRPSSSRRLRRPSSRNHASYIGSTPTCSTSCSDTIASTRSIGRRSSGLQPSEGSAVGSASFFSSAMRPR